jgi:hypothetical protein
MSLSAKYQAFLAKPSADALTDNASLHYITTLTSITTAPAIVKHFTVQEKLLKRKGDKVLNAIESSNALSLEVETTIEFVNGGGAYLPGLDDNFIADRTVTFPMVALPQSALVGFCADPGCADTHGTFRQGAEDISDPSALGASGSAEGGRRHRRAGPQLADQGRKRPGPAHRDQRRDKFALGRIHRFVPSLNGDQGSR